MIYSILLLVPIISASPASYSYHAQRIGRHQGFETFLSNGRSRFSSAILPSLRATQYFYSPNTLRTVMRTSLSSSSSSSVVQQTEDLAEILTSILRDLSNNPASAATVDNIIKDNYNPCLTSLEGSLQSIQTAVTLVKTTGPEIEVLTDKFNSFTKLEDPAIIVRETGAMLRLLKPLAEKSKVVSEENCEGFGSLRSLAVLVTEIADKPQLSLKYGVKSQLRQSAAVLSTVTTFLEQLKSDIARMEKFCTANNQYNRDSIVAIGDLMENLANMYSSLGDIKTGEKIRYGKVYIDGVTAELAKLDLVGLGNSDCSNNGDIRAAAAILDDLATLIEDVGLDALSEQLGADLSFDFSPATATLKRFKL